MDRVWWLYLQSINKTEFNDLVKKIRTDTKNVSYFIKRQRTKFWESLSNVII